MLLYKDKMATPKCQLFSAPLDVTQEPSPAPGWRTLSPALRNADTSPVLQQMSSEGQEGQVSRHSAGQHQHFCCVQRN